MTARSIPSVFREQVLKLKSRPMVYGKAAGHWRPLTWAQMGERVEMAAAGLCALGLDPGDRVGLFAESGPEWVLADLAAASAGLVDVPIFETASPDQVAYILRDARARLVFVDTVARLEILRGLLDALPELEHVVCFGDDEETLPEWPRGHAVSLLGLEGLGAARTLGSEVQRRVDALRESDLLTQVYTSGTTGVPKGVMLSHGNVVSNCEAMARAVPVRSDDVLLSFLPLSHSFERTAGYYVPSLFGGATIYFCEKPGRLFQNMAEVRPTVVVGVPRVYEKIYARFMSARDRAGPLRRGLVELALAVGRRVSRARQAGREPGRLLSAQYQMLYDQVFAPLAERVGGRIRFFVSGGAPLSGEVAELFHAAGFLVLEGYGLTEASPIIAVNRPDAYRFGTVGRPLDNIRVRLAEDGEILVLGPSVMAGYAGLPEATAEVVREGWLGTGDIGEFTHDGFLRITDRKKDLFKTSTGRYIAPQKLERRLTALPLVEQACLVGDRRPYCVALVVPAYEALEAWARERGVPVRDRAGLLAHPRVIRRYQQAIDELNGDLERHETVRGFRLLPEPFSLENGLLTPSAKVRRKEVLRRFGAEIDGLYGEGAHRHRWRRR